MALKLVTDETPSPRRRVKSEKIKTAYKSGDKLRILDAMFQTAASIAEDPDQAARDRTEVPGVPAGQGREGWCAGRRHCPGDPAGLEGPQGGRS